MEELYLDGLQLVGDNLRDKVNFCREGVKLYPLCKIIHPANGELDDYSQIMDYAFVLTSTYELDDYYAIEHVLDECRKTHYGDIIIHNDACIGANQAIGSLLLKFSSLEEMHGSLSRIVDSVKICLS